MRRIVAAIFNREFRLVRFKQCFLVALLCLFLSNVAEAIPMFNMTTTDKVVSLAVGATATITYTVQNNTGVDTPNMRYFPPLLTTLAAGSTCSSVLAKGASCNLLLTIRAPDTESGHILLEPLRVCGFNNSIACSVSDKENRVQLNIVNATQGHFVFRQGATDITNLNLAPNDVGTVTLHNTGGSIISTYNLNIPAAVSSYFSGTCTSVTSLAAGANCNLAYTIPGSPAIGMHSLTASGTNADNSPHTLTVGINVSVVPRAYFSVWGSRDIWQCEINPSTGVFSNCGDTNGSQYYLPTDITFNPAGTRAFITNTQNNLGPYITKCDVDPSNGTFSNCGDTGASGFSFPDGIALNTAGTVALVVNGASSPSNSTIYRCDVNTSTGVFSGCANAGVPQALINAPQGLTLDNSNGKAYVANYNNQNIIGCDVGATGSLSNCVTSSVSGLPNAIALNANGTMAFITFPFNPEVVHCQVNTSTGALSGCADTGATGFTKPNYIKLNQAGTMAFITDSDGNRVIRCDVNTSTGAFSGCTNTGATGFTDPQGIALQAF